MTAESILFAGFAAGFAMGLVMIGVGAMLAVSLSARHQRLLPALPPGASLALVATCAVHLLLGLTTLVVGPALAVVYARVFAVRWPASGLGSPNLAFTTAMVLMGTLAGGTLGVVARTGIVMAALLAAAFAGIFGWLLPWLVR